MAINLSHRGQYPEAEKLFREAVTTAERTNQPTVLGGAWYSFACGAAVAGHHDEAIEYLRQAIDHGYGELEVISSDANLKSLRGNEQFESLLAKLRNAAAAK